MREKRQQLRKAQLEQYLERARFYYDHQERLLQLVKRVKALDEKRLQWPLRKIGILPAAWTYTQNKHFRPTEVFCHPQVVHEDPVLVLYYRALAVLPLKGMQVLAFNTARLEKGNQEAGLTLDRATRLACALNRQISKLITTVEDWTIDKGIMAGAASLGAQVNGSWRNFIGDAAASKLKELVIAYFSQQSLVKKLEPRSGKSVSPTKTLRASQVRTIILQNDYSIRFAAEPDIVVRNPKGELEGAGETKGGLDPAGALERYGAAKKSFEKAREENKSVITFYVAACITKTVRERMAKDQLVTRDFNLLDIFKDLQAHNRFMEYLRWIAHC